jgi:hypothetical protein
MKIQFAHSPRLLKMDLENQFSRDFQYYLFVLRCLVVDMNQKYHIT